MHADHVKSVGLKAMIVNAAIVAYAIVHSPEDANVKGAITAIKDRGNANAASGVKLKIRKNANAVGHAGLLRMIANAGAVRHASALDAFVAQNVKKLSANVAQRKFVYKLGDAYVKYVEPVGFNHADA